MPTVRPLHFELGRLWRKNGSPTQMKATQAGASCTSSHFESQLGITDLDFSLTSVIFMKIHDVSWIFMKSDELFRHFFTIFYEPSWRFMDFFSWAFSKLLSKRATFFALFFFSVHFIWVDRLDSFNSLWGVSSIDFHVVREQDEDDWP